MGLETAEINNLVIGTVGTTDHQLLAQGQSHLEGKGIVVEGKASNFRDIRVAPRGFGFWGARVIDASRNGHSGNPDHN
jgi:hypothetical protein